MKTSIHRFYKTCSSSLMAILVLASLCLLFSFRTVDTKSATQSPVMKRVVTLEDSFQNIHIDGDIKVMLTNEAHGSFVIMGNEKDVSRIKYSVKNNQLNIDARRKNSFETLTIYLPATLLQSILVEGDTDISSNDVIRVNNLRILLNGNSNVHVSVTGKLHVDAGSEFELL